ncbi:syntaxin-17-like [Glandiceps talaboti]
MATFEYSGSPKITHEDDDMPKQPIKRLEHAIRMFTKVAIPTDLERLSQHRHNIEKYQRLQEWEKLNVELINASRTVQQLKANVREMEKTRNQIREEDLERFDERIQGIKEEAIAAVMNFIDLHGNDDQPFSYIASPDETDEPSSEPSYNASQPLLATQQSRSQSQSQGQSQGQSQQQLQVQLRQESEAKESWYNLKDDLVELNTMIHDFSAMVHDQQEQVDSIVDNVESAHGHVQQGVLHLGKAAKYKAMMFPVAGAMIGGVVGGPVGLLAGAKLGMAAAIGGGLIGFTGGKLLKTRQDKVNEIELQNLSNHKRWSSAPELSSEDLLRDSK